MVRKILVLLFVIYCGLQLCHATTISYVDTGTCVVKQFDAKHINAYQNDRDFTYENTKAKSGGLSGLLGFLLDEFFGRINKVHLGSITLYDVLFYGVMFFAAIMIVLQFFKIRVSGLFTAGGADIISHQSFTENVHELDFDKLIQEAISTANFRLATRLHYLKMLKRLSDSGLINWQKNKTNFEYYYELKGEERRKQFYALTRLFESVWYGNFEISEAAFDENLKAFTGFLQTLRR
jgi:hypothetical protein